MIGLTNKADQVISLGDGGHILARGLYQGTAALFIEPTDHPKEPGTLSQGPEETHPHGDRLSKGSTVVTFTRRASIETMILTLQELLDSDTGKALP